MNSKLLNKILRQMQENNMNKTMLSKKSGLHLSEISRILNSKQSLSLHNLDSLTKAFELVEDTFYMYYVAECFLENGFLNKRRSEPFLYTCAAKGFEEPLQQLLDTLLEERSKPILTKNSDHVFTVAEALFRDGKEKESLCLHEIIINSMPNHFSEQVAMYYCAQDKFDEGLHELLDVANKAYEFKHLQRFKQCLQMYWKFKSQINIEHEKKFIQLLT